MLSSEKIKEYRTIVKKIGIWDKDYESIKRDLPHIFDDIKDRDFAMDVLGASLEQMVLMARLVTYGESDNELSEDDLKVLFAPLDAVEDIPNSPWMVGNGVESVIESIFPLLFSTMDESDTYDKFDWNMRVSMALPAKISMSTLSYAIGIGVCLRKYGMSAHFTYLNSKLKHMLMETERAEDIINSSKAVGEAFNFSAMLAAMFVECNLRQSVSFQESYDFMQQLFKLISENKTMYDFIHSREFKLFTRGIEKYHEIDE